MVLFKLVRRSSHLVNFRSSFVRRVQHVNAIAVQRWQDEAISFLTRITKTTAAGIPAHVVQFVARVQSISPMDHLDVEKFRLFINMEVEWP